MKQVLKAIRNFKWGYLMFALLFVASGLAFLAFPEDAMQGVRIAIGVIAIVFSGFAVALTLANRERGFRFWARMVTGVIGMVCGGFMIFAKETAFSYIVFVLGLFLMIDGSFKLQTAILSKRYRSWLWWIMLVLAAGGIALGVVLLRTDFDFGEKLVTVARLVGIGFLLDGILNLLSVYYLYRIEHGQKREIIEELKAEGMIATVTDAEPKEPLSRAERRALKKENKRALKKGKRQTGAGARAEKECLPGEGETVTLTELSGGAPATADGAADGVAQSGEKPAAQEIPLGRADSGETEA